MGTLIGRRISLSGSVMASLFGVYTLIMLGAALSVTDALAICNRWPTCDGRWLVHPSDPVAIAMGHRLLAFFVGIVLAGTVVLAWRRDPPRRVQLMLTGALVLYPIQGLIGRFVALGLEAPFRSWLHLGVGVAIFSVLVVSLAWILEEQYPGAIDRSSADAPARGHEPAPSEPAGAPKPMDRVMAYVRLTKPKLMWLLCLVAAAGMTLAAGSGLEVRTIVATLGGGVLAIGASGTFNHVLERDVDRRMARTADRPVATQVVPITHALVFGLLLASASMLVFVLLVNIVAAAITATAIAFYSVVYTLLLKPNTVQNTAIGGFAGALPALIGWSAVTGGVELPGIVLALVVFCWTPAHFYNLAMAYKEDYAAGGFPMLPVVRGDQVARKHILYWTGATMVTVAALAATATLGWLYVVAGIAGAAVFVSMIRRLHAESTRAAAFRAFHASNAYLGLLLVVITIDAFLG